MKESKSEINPDNLCKDWQKSPIPNLIRYVSTGIYFAGFRVGGKLIPAILILAGRQDTQHRVEDFSLRALRACA